MGPSANAPDTAHSSRYRSPIPTPHWGPQGTPAFTIRAIVRIDATPDVILDRLLDTSKYPEWNNFVPRVTLPYTTRNAKRPEDTGRLKEGTLFTEHVDMYGHGKPSGLVKMKLLMTTMEELEDEGKKIYKVVWLGKVYPDWALRSERVHLVACNDDGSCNYVVWETFSGPLALLVRLFVGGALVKRFGQWNQELKEYAEQQH